MSINDIMNEWAVELEGDMDFTEERYELLRQLEAALDDYLTWRTFCRSTSRAGTIVRTSRLIVRRANYDAQLATSNTTPVLPDEVLVDAEARSDVLRFYRFLARRWGHSVQLS